MANLLSLLAMLIVIITIIYYNLNSFLLEAAVETPIFASKEFILSGWVFFLIS